MSKFTRHHNDATSNAQLTICDLIKKQALSQPKKNAIVDGDTQIEFERFTAKANAVANELHARGIQRGALVGVCMNRTWELIATLLGVMQAGCAYVPLDPKYPQERIRYMLEHSRAGAVVVDDESTAELCEDVNEQIWIDKVTEQTSSLTSQDIDGPSPNDLAYVIYTSGSTGKPKGVAVEHRSVLSFIKTLDALFDDKELSGMLATSSVCFDSSITETLGAMSLGGTVILAQNGLALSEPSFADKIKSCVMIPSVLQIVLREGELPEGLRCLIVGGEALKRPLAEQLHQWKPDLRLVNVYGPTEDTVFSITKEIAPGAQKITIGKSVSGSRAYILDDALQNVGVGVAGELFLSGDKLARGYLYDEQRTQERFIEVELSEGNAKSGLYKTKVRLYKTGDICQWTPEGEIEFLGRADEQVKIRGFRIELAEIETVLESMPGVNAVAAIARESALGQKILVVYVVSQDGEVTEAGIKAYLAQRLPNYMVPQIITYLSQLPYMPNGKLDRKQLHNLEQQGQVNNSDDNIPHDGLGGTGEAQRMAVQSMIQREVAALLSLSDPHQVSPDFSLDGFALDSLSKVELRNRIGKAIGRKLPAQVVYEHSTVAALVNYILNFIGSDAEPLPTEQTRKTVSDSLGNFQSQIQTSHPTFQAAKARAWSATDKGKLVQQMLQMVNDERRNPYGKVIRTGSGARGTVLDPYNAEEQEAIIWTTNLYFGLNRDKDVIKQASAALHDYGTGMGISAAATGMLDQHLKFEQSYAELVGKSAACLFPTGYTANLGGIAGLLGEDDVVIIDSLCHASIVDGAHLSGATIRTFQHNNVDDLESVLKSEVSPYHTVLVVIEGVYSMGEGTAPVASLVRMVKKYDALILVDEAHSFGFYGERGAGICAAQGVSEEVDFVMTTLSKALGSIGGVIAASKEHIELLKSSSRAYIFQASISPADIAAALASLKRLSEDDSLREQLWDRATYMRQQFADAGFDLGTGDGPIVTPHFADKDKLYAIVQGLSQRGVQTSAVTYPIVEKGRGRLRFICSAAHTKEDIDKTLAALIEAESEADELLANPVEHHCADLSLPLSDVAQWTKDFAEHLKSVLLESSSPTPNLAIKLTIAGNESSVTLVLNEREISMGDKDIPDIPSFSMQLSDDQAITALCSSDIQLLLYSINKGSCVLHGLVEPFIWFIARVADRQVSL